MILDHIRGRKSLSILSIAVSPRASLKLLYIPFVKIFGRKPSLAKDIKGKITSKTPATITQITRI
jgi:hypothetical protein